MELLMHKHLTDQASEEEREQVLRMLNENSEQGAEARALEMAWDAAENLEPVKGKFDAAAAFARFQSQVTEEKKEETPILSLPDTKVKSLNWRKYMSYAAVLLGLMAFSALFFNNNTSYSAGDAAMAVSLDDGSSINIAPNSELEVLGDRKIAFDGNGYFDIHHDAAHPFTIALEDGATVTVLGTSFTIEKDGKNTFVSLESGKVRLNKDGQELTLVPGEYAKLNDRIVKDVVNSDNAYSLKKGFLTFNDTPLSQVSDDFKRHHNTTLIFNGSDLNVNDCTLTANKIAGKDAMAAAKVIAKVFDGKLTQNDEGFVISNVDCN